MRNNDFLIGRFKYIWEKYFSDYNRPNRIIIQFGRKAEKRLGSIRRTNIKGKKFDTLILLNGYFKDKSIPEYVIDATIAHELVHYIHGFSSPLPQLSRFPHRGGKIEREMERRDLGWLLEKETAWLNSNWIKYIKSVK